MLNCVTSITIFMCDNYNYDDLTGFAISKYTTKAQILFGGYWTYATQAYENRLFFLKAAGAGDVAVSAEDALIAQHASAESQAVQSMATRKLLWKF